MTACLESVYSVKYPGLNGIKEAYHAKNSSNIIHCRSKRFIGGAFLFIPTGFFEATDVVTRIAGIENNRFFWTLAWIGLPAGGMITAGGFLALARHFQQTDERRWLYSTASIVAIAATICAFTYVISGFLALTNFPGALYRV